MLRALYKRFSHAIFSWSLKRSPRQKQTTLSQKRIYIFPSRSGAVFLLLLIILLLLAINYQNNLIFGFTFLLASMFVVAILHTYANLSGLTINFVRGYPCFAGEQAGFDIQLSSRQQREYENIQLRWRRGESQVADLSENAEVDIRLYQPTKHRGELQAGALLVETHYPLGLFRAWTWLQADLKTIIYPKPVAGGSLPESSGFGHQGEGGEQDGTEEFAGLENYHPGNSLKRVAWKQFARGQGLHVKRFVDAVDSECWLSLEFWPELSVEERLSRLTWWALKLDRMEQSYGLKLPGITIAPGRGEAHRVQVLETLACYGKPGNQSAGGTA